MADASTYVIRLAGWLGKAIGDSAPVFADFSTETLGLTLPAAVLEAGQVKSALRGAETTATRAGTAADQLATAATAGDDLLPRFVALGVALGEFYAALDNLTAKVHANVTAGTVPDAQDRAAAQALTGQLAKRLNDVILSTAITDHYPEFGVGLRFLGLLQWRRVQKEEGNPLSHDYILRTLEINRLTTLITNPAEHYRQAVGWGDRGFDPTDVFELYSALWDPEVDVEVGISAGEPSLRHGEFRISRNSVTQPPSLTLSFNARLSARPEKRRALNEHWGIGTSVSMIVNGNVSGALEPVLNFTLQPLDGSMTGEVQGFFNRNPEARPLDILSGVEPLSISASDVKAGFGATANWDGTRATVVPLLFADIEQATVKIGTTDADSFVDSLVAEAPPIEGAVDLGLEWTPDEGLRVKASGGVEIALPLHKSLGPLTFDTLYFILQIGNDGTLSFEVSAALTGTLGPLAASVNRIGTQLDVRFAEGTDAAFGPFDAGLRFKPPSGIGLSIDAGVVKGGGYVDFDPAKGEYSGALELTFSDFLSLKAIGLITTKMPGGAAGFSLVVIITAEFSPGFQLGFGFVLTGVGGLLGLHRAVLLEPLSQGVRTGAANNMLFPANVVENAPRIISDLRVIFPPEPGTFLIGPMAKIEWGTPPLISLSLGIIIEIPGNVVILGRLRVNLPTEQTALVLLQVMFIGAIEFDKRRIWFFASLFESRVLFITLDGEMGLLMDFSDDPNFVLSVGGFHPRYVVPALPFPSPRRISLSLINESFARVRVEGYFAVTSNSVQFGSRTEMFFGFDALSVEGHIAFDALLQFSPLYFIVEVSVGFSVKVFGLGVFGVHLRGSLEGPTPWRVQGEATITLLFFDISVDVDVTFGESNKETLPPIPVMPLLRGELDKASNWVAGLPSSGQWLTTLRELGEAGALVLHPVGTLKITQRAMPLNLKLDKVGNQKTADVTEVSLEVTAVGLAVADSVRERFARAQYQEIDDAGKLSKPAFEKLDSGIELAATGGQWAAGRAAMRTVRYETIVIDTSFERYRIKFFKFWGALFAHFARGCAASKTTMSLATAKKKQPFAAKVELTGDRYVVAFTSTNRPYTGATRTFGSHAEAEHYMNRTVSANPEIAEEIHVIPELELNAA